MTVPVQRLVAAIDLGSSKVTGIIGEVTGDARSWGLRVLGIGTEETTATRRGTIREIRGVVVSDAVTIRLTRVENTLPPLLCGVELIADETP